MGQTICIAQSKGGSSKTTVAQLLIGVMVNAGKRVAAIDGDVNKSLTTWLENFTNYDIECHHILDENEMLPKAQELEEKNDLLVIDTAGARTQATMYAIGVADLVIIPVQKSSSNILEAAKTFQQVQSTSKLVKRDIPTYALMTRHVPKTNMSKHIRKELEDLGIPIMQSRLHQLVGYEEMSYSEVPTKGKVAAQAQLLVAEIQRMGLLPFMENEHG